jgi:hypothetical protein
MRFRDEAGWGASIGLFQSCPSINRRGKNFSSPPHYSPLHLSFSSLLSNFLSSFLYSSSFHLPLRSLSKTLCASLKSQFVT